MAPTNGSNHRTLTSALGISYLLRFGNLFPRLRQTFERKITDQPEVRSVGQLTCSLSVCSGTVCKHECSMNSYAKAMFADDFFFIASEKKFVCGQK